MKSRAAMWIPSFTMLAVSLISYIDRNTLALLAPTILKEAKLSAEQYGYIISAFSVAYMVGNPVWGVLLDRLGLRRGMFASVSFWTLASASHAFAGVFWHFAVARVALGFGEGATFPAGLRAAVQSLPGHLQSRGIAISYSGGSLGAMVTPVLVTPIALAWGWRGAFLFTGLVGVSWLLLWTVVSRRPDMSGYTVVHGPKPAVRYRDPKVWSFMAAYALGGFPLAFVLYQSALYLSQVMGASQADIGKVLWIPPLGWEVGYFVWGWVTDRTVAWVDPFRAYRWLMAAAMILSLPLALVTSAGAYPLVLFQLFFAMFVAAGFVIVPISYATRVFSAANAGLIAGLGAGAWGAFVALVMPSFGRLFDQQNYHLAFLLASLFPAGGYTIWSLINRSPKEVM